MSNWINGNIPDNKDVFYWLTVKSTIKNITHPVPCRFKYCAEMMDTLLAVLKQCKSL